MMEASAIQKIIFMMYIYEKQLHSIKLPKSLFSLGQETLLVCLFLFRVDIISNVEKEHNEATETPKSTQDAKKNDKIHTKNEIEVDGTVKY